MRLDHLLSGVQRESSRKGDWNSTRNTKSFAAVARADEELNVFLSLLSCQGRKPGLVAQLVRALC